LALFVSKALGFTDTPSPPSTHHHPLTIITIAATLFTAVELQV
jgi:hypothetical protein